MAGRPGPYSKHTQRRHVERVLPKPPPDVRADPVLASAWHSLQLHWLQTIPGYRAELTHRVSIAAKQAESKLNRAYNNDFAERGPRIPSLEDWVGRDDHGCT